MGSWGPTYQIAKEIKLSNVFYVFSSAGLKTYEDVLQLSASDVSRCTNLSQNDSILVQMAVSQKVYRQPKLTGQKIILPPILVDCHSHTCNRNSGLYCLFFAPSIASHHIKFSYPEH